jgi:hypothetical protein
VSSKALDQPDAAQNPIGERKVLEISKSADTDNKGGKCCWVETRGMGCSHIWAFGHDWSDLMEHASARRHICLAMMEMQPLRVVPLSDLQSHGFVWRLDGVSFVGLGLAELGCITLERWSMGRAEAH